QFVHPPERCALADPVTGHREVARLPWPRRVRVVSRPGRELLPVDAFDNGELVVLAESGDIQPRERLPDGQSRAPAFHRRGGKRLVKLVIGAALAVRCGQVGDVERVPHEEQYDDACGDQQLADGAQDDVGRPGRRLAHLAPPGSGSSSAVVTLTWG